MPKESIRDQIFVDIKELLKNIKGGTDYFYIVSDENINIIHGNASKTPFKEPYIYLYPGVETYIPSQGERGLNYKSLNIDIEAWIRVDIGLENMNNFINRIIHDIEKCLMLNHHLDNKIHDIIFLNNTAFMEALDSPKAGVIVSISAVYQVDYQDPSNQTVFT